jgi:penicillin G amidase
MKQGPSFTLPGIKGEVKIQRLENGHPHILASEELDLYYGLGYMHATDRQVQMWLTKIIGNGRGSEYLDPSPLMIETDKYMRWIDLAGDARGEVEMLTLESRAIVEAYCKGVNDAARANAVPLEFRMVGYKADEWTVADVLLAAKMIGFVGLASTQADSEKFIIQLLQNGLEPARLKELFPAIKEDITPEFIEIVKQIKTSMPIISPDVPWKRLLPSFSASNNWAVAPQKSASGKSILCADPHLGLQLPCIWYTVSLRCGDHFLTGATVPGAPAVAIGRSNHLAWAATYGTMDLSDFFIENIKDGKVRRGDEWIAYDVREEIIRPKKGTPITLRVCSTEHGPLESEPSEDGYYLSFALSIKKYPGSAAQSLESFSKIFKAKTASEALDYFAGLTFSPFNWLIADEENIGYQLGGLFPAKRAGTSGLLPYLGWDLADDWCGPIDPRRYPRTLNPEGGIHITANNDFNHLGDVQPMTLPMASYRADLICRRLEEKEKLTVDDMKHIHYDSYSLQAEKFMALFKPLLPETPNGRILRDWDCRYTADSIGATLFEKIYLALVKLVFGEMGFGTDVMSHAVDETTLFSMLYGNFDAVLLNEESVWFNGKPRVEIFKEAILRGLAAPAPRHGETRRIFINNLFFGGKAPRFLGFDYEFEHIGSRATIPQSQMYRSAERDNSFAATFRMVCNFANDELHANMCGGASGQRFSPYYNSGMKEWLEGRYQVIKP